MPNHFVSALQSRFNDLEQKDNIRQRVTRIPMPKWPVADLEHHLVRAEIANLLGQLYIPTSADLDLFVELIHVMKAHCHTVYPTDQEYLNNLYRTSGDKPGPDEAQARFSPPICLTGPAGVGKTTFLEAFRRLLPDSMDIELGRGHSCIPTEAYWYAQVQGRTTAATILKPFVEDQLGRANTRGDKIQKLCAKVAHDTGVALFALDELQFLTQSSTANTQVTKVLYQLGYLGLPFIFVANYSLCHLLKRRPEQDRQRLLSKPRVLLPLTPDTPDWADYLAAVQTVLGHSLRINLLHERHVIYQFTAGVRRLFVQLFTLSYDLAWQKGQRHITQEDLRAAYDHTEFTVGREQVSAMLSPYTQRNKEYECPFDLPKVNAAALLEQQNQRQLEQIARAVQIDALPPAERKTVQVATKQSTRRPPRKKVTAKELRQNMHMLQQPSSSK